MNLEIRPFHRDHLHMFTEQTEMSYLRPHLTEAHLLWWEQSGMAFTAIDGSDVVGCGGISIAYPQEPLARGEAWAVFPDPSRYRRQFVLMFREIKKFLRNCPVRRIEAVVDDGLCRAHKFARKLGFKHEAKMPLYRPDGRDAHMYVLRRV